MGGCGFRGIADSCAAHLGVGESWKPEEQGVESSGSVAPALSGVHRALEAGDGLLAAYGLGLPIHEAERQTAARVEHAGQMLRSAGSGEGRDSLVAPQ